MLIQQSTTHSRGRADHNPTSIGKGNFISHSNSTTCGPDSMAGRNHFLNISFLFCFSLPHPE